jgi:bifunctional enzyme CysN/CysC
MSTLLRLATAGSVDDGKSTLIGRLLYDSKSLMADQVADAEVDLARLTDGLRAEREQGITIDVAYRFFATPERSFIIADTPGHVRYTRNMVTGASTADLAVVLVDARNGVLEQSRRHAYLSAQLGIKHMVACVNKMDLVDWDEARFREIEDDFGAVLRELGVQDATAIPISALQIMLPRPASRSSARCTTTDIGGTATSTGPSSVSIRSTVVRSPLGSTTTSSPARSTPLAIWPA